MPSETRASPSSMAMRAKEFDPGGPIDPNSADQFKVGSANQMASMLAEWDIKAALPVLKARAQRLAGLLQAQRENGPKIFGLEERIESLTRLRTQAGDPQALDDFAGWIRAITPAQHDARQIAIFEPLWSNPDHPAVIAAAAAAVRRPEIALESLGQFPKLCDSYQAQRSVARLEIVPHACPQGPRRQDPSGHRRGRRRGDGYRDPGQQQDRGEGQQHFPVGH